MSALTDTKELNGVFGVVNRSVSKGFPIDEKNRLTLDRVRSISVMSALTDTEGLITLPNLLYRAVNQIQTEAGSF